MSFFKKRLDDENNFRLPRLIPARTDIKNQKVVRIDYILNKKLEKAFMDMKSTFERLQIPVNEVYMFHATSKKAVDKVQNY